MHLHFCPPCVYQLGYIRYCIQSALIAYGDSSKPTIYKTSIIAVL
nr:MAG TPA: hypothetical protein [Caudoviricetes sp.]